MNISAAFPTVYTIEFAFRIAIPLKTAFPPMVSALTRPVRSRLGKIPSQENVRTSSAAITAVAEPDIIPHDGL